MSAFIDWNGPDGPYKYWFLEVTSGGRLLSQPGNYMFVKNTRDNLWRPIYVGIADDLRDRVLSHEVWDEAVRHGASRVMAHRNANRDAREREERALIGHWNPVCNTHHRTPKAS